MTMLLFILHENLWICDALTLGGFFALALKQRAVGSNFLTIAIVFTMSRIIINYSMLVAGFGDPMASRFSFYWWCVTFSLANIALMWAFYYHYPSIKQANKRWFNVLYIGFVMALMGSLIYVQFGPLLFGIEGITYKTWVRVAHYMGIALLDGIAIVAIHRLHVLARLKYSAMAKMYLLAFFVAGCLQLARFAERYIFDTHYLAGIYRWGLASINITTTAIVLAICAMAIYQHYNNKKPRGI